MSSQIYIPSRERREDQHLFIGGREIYGIQQFSCDYSLGAIPIEFLGATNTVEMPDSAQTATISLNTLMIELDPLIQYTGNVSFNGYVVNAASDPGSNNFSFTNTYLNSYNVRCGVGQIPEISAELTSYGNAGFLPDSYSSQVDTDFAAISTYASGLNMQIASYGSIEVNLDDFTTNRLQSFQVNISTPRNPIYSLGSRTPYFVDQVYPIEVNASFSIDVNDYLAYRLNDYPTSPLTENLTLSFNEYSSGTNIISYAFNNMRFQGLRYSTDVNSNVSVEYRYRGFIEAPNNAIDNFRCDTTVITCDDTRFSWDYQY